MQNNSYLKIKKYFEKLVKNHCGICSFSGYFNRDLQHQESTFDGISSPYLALFKYELGLEGPKQNTIAVRKVAFALMFNDIPADDFEAQYTAIDNAEQLALQVLARVQLDNNNKNHLLYNTFLKDSVRVLPVELSNTAFGVEVYFSLKNPQKLTVDPNEWKDIDKVC